MAERRMFAKSIIDSDAFLEMPLSAHALYFHLSMRADDDGFINNPRSIMRTVGCKEDDMNLLILKKFILLFDKGIIVIKHWKIHNYIQKDRYNPTKYKDEKAQLEYDENHAYRLINGVENNECIQDVYNMDTQVRLGKVRLGKKDMVIENDQLSQIENWFNEFWSKYPKKVQRKTSLQRFKQYVKTKLIFEQIIADVEKRSQSDDWLKENGKYIPNPTTYLNQERWNDEIDYSRKSSPNKRVEQITDYQIAESSLSDEELRRLEDQLKNIK